MPASGPPAPAGGFRAARGRRPKPDGNGAAGGLRLGQRASDGIATDEGAAYRGPRRQASPMPRKASAKASLTSWSGALKRLMIDTMARKNDFAALRAIDMIARLRGLTPATARRSDGLEAALEEIHQQPPAPEETGDEEPAPPPPTRKSRSTRRCRPNSRRRSNPPAPEPQPPSPAQTREAATEAARAAVRRRLFCYEHLIAHHPELSSKSATSATRQHISTPTTTCSRRSFGQSAPAPAPPPPAATRRTLRNHLEIMTPAAPMGMSTFPNPPVLYSGAAPSPPVPRRVAARIIRTIASQGDATTPSRRRSTRAAPRMVAGWPSASNSCTSTAIPYQPAPSAPEASGPSRSSAPYRQARAPRYCGSGAGPGFLPL